MGDGGAKFFDVVVAGAGPAGIAAAVTAAEGGKRVAMVDDNPAAGGQIWRQGIKAPPRTARKWLARLAAASAISRLAGTRIIAAPAPGTLLTESSAGAGVLRYGSLILATGARELFLPFPGWTTPGVFGVGGIQALVKAGLPVRGKRIIIAGSGPLLLAVAALLHGAGARVLLIAEQTPAAKLRSFAMGLLGVPHKLAGAIALRATLLGIRYVTDGYVLGVTPKGPGLRATLRIGAGMEEHECDYLACGFGLIPNIELPLALGCRLTPERFVATTAGLGTSQANVYAAGEITGIGGVDKAIIEGCIAANSALGTGGGTAMERGLARSCVFADRLSTTFALRPELLTLADDRTIVCRCEDVPLAAVKGRTSGRDAKLQTRCGMGPCQGRICGPVLRLLQIEDGPDGQVRPPLFPAAVGTLAAAIEG